MMIIHTDASVTRSGAGIAWKIEEYPYGSDKNILEKGRDFMPGEYSSVEGEYEAIVRAVREAIEFVDQGEYLIISSDCEPVVNHLDGSAPMCGKGEFYKKKVISAIQWFEGCNFNNIPRDQNKDRDMQARLAVMNHG